MKIPVLLLVVLLISQFLFTASREFKKIGLKRKTVNVTKEVHGRSISLRQAVPTYKEDVVLQQLLFGTIQIGGNDYTVLFDTGSPYLWINGVSCKTCLGYGFAPGHDCSKSKTCKKMNKKFDIVYGIGSARCDLVTESVTLENTLTAKNFKMGLAYSDADDDDLAGFNGILGLGFPLEYPTYLEVLKSQKQIPEILFGLFLSYQMDGDSIMTIGGADETLIDFTKTYYSFNLLPSIFWQTSLSAIKSGGTSIKGTKSSNAAIFDSGTSLLLFDTDTANAYLKLLANRNLRCQLIESYIVICSARLSSKQAKLKTPEEVFDDLLPPLEFTIQNQVFTLEGRYLVGGYSLSGTNVQVQILLGGGELEENILGDPVFRKYYVIFYGDQKKLMLFHKNPTATTEGRE